MDLGHLSEFHLADDAPVVVGGPGGVGDDLRPSRRLVERDAIDGLVRRVQDPHRQEVLPRRTDLIRDIQLERPLSPLVSPHVTAVHPHIRLVVNRLEPQQGPAVNERAWWRLECSPVPRQAVVTWECPLDDPGHAASLSLLNRPLVPVPRDPLSSGIDGYEPVIAIERDDGAWLL